MQDDNKNDQLANAPEKSGGKELPKNGAEDPQFSKAVDSSREAVNVGFDQPGGLEVAEMKESQELQERRASMKNRIQQNTEVSKQVGGAFEDDGSGLADMLKEANLSPRHLRFCLSGIILLVLLFALIFGGSRLIKWFNNRPAKEVKLDEVEEVIEDDSVIVIPNEDEYAFLDPSLIASFMIGDHEAKVDPATVLGQDLGDGPVSQDELTQYILEFGDLFNAVDVDVNELMNQSSNRRDTLTDYMNELQFLRGRSERNLFELEAETESLALSFDSAETDRDLFEARFFEDLNELDAYGAVAALDQFISEGEEVVRLRAEYLARLELILYYELVLAELDVKLRDVELNEEALVKGIQVVEVGGSDLNLILQESDL